MDEFDTIAGLKADDKSMARSVNALLQAMDGVTSYKGVSVIAATNYPWKIESAVLRRFGNLIFVDLVEGPAMLQIMEMTIANNYALPGMPKSSRYEMMKKNVYEFVHQYGVGLCEPVKIPRQKRGYTGTYTEETSSRLITREILTEIIKTQLGMNSSAVNVRNTILNSDSPRRVMMSEFTAANMPIFGYSPSDISKVMQIAIKNASRRALIGKFKKIKVEGNEWFIAAIEGTYKINDIPASQQQYAYNFSLCEHDIEFAVASYKPTVKPQDYMDLLRYKKWRLAPDEDDIV